MAQIAEVGEVGRFESKLVELEEVLGVGVWELLRGERTNTHNSSNGNQQGQAWWQGHLGEGED